jgi:hippurate hydrolase
MQRYSVGTQVVNGADGSCGLQDFSFMLEKVPGCCVNLGNNKGEGGCEIHNPAYDFNDAALPLGAAFFARLVERRLGKGAA